MQFIVQDKSLCKASWVDILKEKNKDTQESAREWTETPVSRLCQTIQDWDHCRSITAIVTHDGTPCDTSKYSCRGMNQTEHILLLQNKLHSVMPRNHISSVRKETLVNHSQCRPISDTRKCLSTFNFSSVIHMLYNRIIIVYSTTVKYNCLNFCPT